MGGKYRTYISFVIQKEEHHQHDFAIVDFALPKYNFYLDNSSQQVVKWAEEKQREFKENEKIIIQNFFNVVDVK
jgi:hypothetical protein